MSDPLLEEANRRAHRGMRALCKAVDDAENHRSGYYRSVSEIPELVKAAKSYEEIERRQEREATA